MAAPPEAHSWFGTPETVGAAVDTPPAGIAFLRLWRGFMAVRILTGAVLMSLQLLIFAIGPSSVAVPLSISGFYLLAAIAVRLKLSPSLPVRALDAQWALTIGVDLLVFAALQAVQGSSVVNYTPLLALPVLLASILGTITLAFGTTAAVTLLMLADAWWLSLEVPAELTARFLQAALSGTGLFIVAFLANQLAQRLAGEEQRAEQGRRAVRLQSLVNELVIDNLTDGVLVVDSLGLVRAANPAAHRLLGATEASAQPPFSLWREPAWQSVGDLAMLSFERRAAQTADVTIDTASPLRAHLRTRLASAQGDDPAGSVCVIFMQDLREMEARVRTEKLAAMGRMSAAVAHEIRNPLAAIAQANALLEEDLTDPAQRQLTGLVAQNTLRLSRIVEEVLDIARVPDRAAPEPASTLELDAALTQIVADWAVTTGNGARLRVQPEAPRARVQFETEHLRRLLVNLLDNASRYAGQHNDSIIVDSRLAADGRAILQVWSDGAPLEQAVRRHLFEPFFSSEARSSGLGLYICRELCERHGAVIFYERLRHRGEDGQAMPKGVEGNGFFVNFRTAGAAATIAP